MSDYIVSARKYRPDSFGSLIGQDNIARTLKNSIARGQLAHAYLFCGPRGVGKTSAARIFAKTINCSNPGPDFEPCGECESCRSFQEGRSYCIHELDAASNNGVEDIKTLMDQVQIPPQTGRYSVFIIDEVHMLSASAFNAFLKTLEEPPSHAIFILATTEKHKILPTILSRCQIYDFSRISIPDIVGNLRRVASAENVSVDDESLHIIASKADGAMRDALTIFDQVVAFCGNAVQYGDVMRNLNVLDYEYCFRLVDSFLSGDYATALLIFDEVLSKGFNPQYFISALGSHLRDLLVCGTGGLESLVDFPDSLRRRYGEQASRCPVKFLYEALSASSQCEAGYRAAVNQRLHIEFALMKMSFIMKAPGAAPAVSAAACAAPAPAQAAAPAPAAAAPEAAPADARTAPAVLLRETAAPVSQTAPAVPAAALPAPSASAVPAAPDGHAAQAGPSAQEAAGSPAPVAAPPAARRRPARTAASLSLGSLMSGDDPAAGETDDTPGKDAAAAPLELPDDEAVHGAWARLSESYSDKPRLANALNNAGLEISREEGRLTVVFSVTNEAQKKWIEERMLRELESRFGSMLHCSRLRLEAAVSPEGEQPEVKYLPSEKAEDLMRQNDEVKNLVKDLSLDVNL